MITKKSKRKQLSKFFRNYLSKVVTIATILIIMFTIIFLFSSESTRTQDTLTESSTTLETLLSEPASETEVSLDVVTVSKDKLVVDIEETSVEPEVPTYYIQLTDDEKDILATLLYLEGNTESLECQKAICSVILNRMTMWDMTLEEVVYQKTNGFYQFSPAPNIEYYEPTITQIQIVEELIMSGPTIPEYVCFFRSDYYHDWPGINDFECFDHTYFSYSDKDKANFMENNHEV